MQAFSTSRFLSLLVDLHIGITEFLGLTNSSFFARPGGGRSRRIQTFERMVLLFENMTSDLIVQSLTIELVHPNWCQKRESAVDMNGNTAAGEWRIAVDLEVENGVY